jgi:hypothetical protein
MVDSLVDMVDVLDNRGSCTYNGYFASEPKTIDRLMVVAEKCRV